MSAYPQILTIVRKISVEITTIITMLISNIWKSIESGKIELFVAFYKLLF